MLISLVLITYKQVQQAIKLPVQPGLNVMCY